MISVTPLTSTALDHRAYYVAVAARSGAIAAVSGEGAGTLIAADGSVLARLSLPEANAVAIHPDGTHLALATNKALVLAASGRGAVVQSHSGKFDSCKYSTGGAWLWAVRRPSGDKAVIELRSASSLEIIATAGVEDPFGESQFILTFHPDDSSIAIWAAAGQDGQAIFWASYRNGALVVEQYDGPEASTPPSMSPEGDHFLIVADFAELRQCTYPNGPHRVVLSWSDDEGEDQDIGDYAAFAGYRHAVLQSRNGLLSVVDLSEGGIIDEIAIAGHVPRPLSEIFTHLHENTSMGTDLAQFVPLRDLTFLSVHHRVPFDPLDRKDIMVTWRLRPEDLESAVRQDSFTF
ncbi:MAG: hypothetical protein P4L99_26395 [Chthoniobacter sp.]|nr:hypothetical protein [Chthoniobacter sp.]